MCIKAGLLWGNDTCCTCPGGAELSCPDGTCSCEKTTSKHSQTSCKDFISLASLAIIVTVEFLTVTIACWVIFYYCLYRPNKAASSDVNKTDVNNKGYSTLIKTDENVSQSGDLSMRSKV